MTRLVYVRVSLIQPKPIAAARLIRLIEYYLRGRGR